MIFTFLGAPIPQKRHRTFRRGVKTIQYDPLAKEKEEIRRQAIEQLKEKGYPQPLFDDSKPLTVDIEFILPIPKSLSKKKREAILNNEIQANHSPGDLDNFAKLALDALNGIGYVDDHQIVALYLTKKYGIEPKTIVEIFSL